MLQHLAAIMDGNRRWARQQGLSELEGHTQGVKAVRASIDFCLHNNIPYLSLYTFSLENFKRSHKEKEHLFALLALQAEAHLDESLEKGIRLRFVGDRSLFPEQVRNVCERVEEKTKHLDKLQVNFLFCYGGQQEIVAATQEIARKALRGELDVATLAPDTFNNYLWLGDVPAPDLIIRTGGVQRLSNFLLFQAAYSEFYFSDAFWPEMTEDYLQKVLQKFKKRKRNFGK